MFKKKEEVKFSRYVTVGGGKSDITVFDIEAGSRLQFSGDIERAKKYAARLLEFHGEVLAAIEEASRLEGAVASIYGK